MAFAVVLIFMELGLLGGVGRTATMLYDKLRFDLLLTSSEYLDLSRPGRVPPRAAGPGPAADGVDDVIPLSFGVGGVAAAVAPGLFGRTPGGGVMSINVARRPAGPGRPRVPRRAGRRVSDAEEAAGAGAAICPARRVPLRPPIEAGVRRRARNSWRSDPTAPAATASD